MTRAAVQSLAVSSSHYHFLPLIYEHWHITKPRTLVAAVAYAQSSLLLHAQGIDANPSDRTRDASSKLHLRVRSSGTSGKTAGALLGDDEQSADVEMGSDESITPPALDSEDTSWNRVKEAEARNELLSVTGKIVRRREGSLHATWYSSFPFKQHRRRQLPNFSHLLLMVE